MLFNSLPQNVKTGPAPKLRLPLEGFNEDAALRAILEGTAPKTGQSFFAALVKSLATVTNTWGAWVTEYIPESRRLRAFAFWLGGELMPAFEHAIDGTACAIVIDERRLVHYADNVFELFPEDYAPEMKNAGIVSYMGVPLLDSDDNVLGHLAIVDTRHMPKEPRAVAILQIFAARAAAELQRLRVESALRERNFQLEKVLADLQKTQAALEKARTRLETENQRKTRELEKARRLQLAMLPKKFPQSPHFEIETYMKTATEVGGDYYDFQTGPDGALSVMIGDATGHGLNAGMMVTATKSILAALRDEPDLVKVFKRANEALKHVNLHRHYMALQMIKLQGERLEVCSAGMPPLLLYRAATQTVEEINLKALPLGSVADFSYQKRELKIAAGDVILLMSDGFPERFNPAGETFDEERVKAVFAEIAPQSPRQIIEHLVRAGEAWANGEAPRDDLTLLVLKVN